MKAARIPITGAGARVAPDARELRGLGAQRHDRHGRHHRLGRIGHRVRRRADALRFGVREHDGRQEQLRRLRHPVFDRQICQGGQCQCQGGLMDCNGSCVPSDANHCGTCTNICQATEVCLNGTCATDCVAQTVCGTACVALTTSDANCGNCGHACGSGQHCVSGNCVDSSPTGTAGTSGNAGTSGGGGSIGTTGSAGTIGTPGTSGSIGTGRGGSGGAGGSVDRRAAVDGTAGTGGTPPTMLLVTSAPGAYWNTDRHDDRGDDRKRRRDRQRRHHDADLGRLRRLVQRDGLELPVDAQRQPTATRRIQLLSAPTGRASRSAASRSAPATTRSIATRWTRSPADDTTLANFSIARDMKKLIPYIKAAQAVKGNIRFWASPWTPPTWMKQGPFSVRQPWSRRSTAAR